MRASRSFGWDWRDGSPGIGVGPDATGALEPEVEDGDEEGFPVAGPAIVLSWPGLPVTALTGQLENLYGALGVLGVVTLAILGMLHKILPFLVWYGRYSREVGKHRVPSFGELYSARLQAAAYWLYVAGVAGLSVGIVRANNAGVRAGTVMLVVSVALFACNSVKILSHLWQPSLEPLAKPATKTVSR